MIKNTANALTLGKILKIVFLGNGRYWPTMVFFWFVVIYLFVSYLGERSIENIFIIFIGIIPAVILIILQFFTSAPLQYPPLYRWFDKRGLTDQDCSGLLCFPAFHIYIIIIFWFIVILSLNFLALRLFEKHNKNKNPQQN